MKSAFRRLLFGVALTGTATSAIFCGLAVVAALRFSKRKRTAEAGTPAFTPPVSVLKPLHGSEAGLRRSLESYFQQEYPAPYELLFCARGPDDPGLLLAREMAARYPAQPARFLACGEPRLPNPKMYSLAVMTAAAAYPHLVTSDADCRVRPDYLLRSVQPLAPAGDAATLAFSLYRGAVDKGSLWMHLDAAGKSVEMASGVLIADMLSGTDFALGVSMALHKEAFDEAGGCDDLGHFWAEDYVLGNRLADAGHLVMISPHVVEMMLADHGAWRSFRDQLRWMQSTRRSRPWGHLGTGLTFAMPFGVTGFIASAAGGAWALGLALLAVAVLNRMLQAFALLRALGERRRLWLYTLLYPVRDLLGFAVWVCSYLPADTRYHGTRFRIMPDGRLQAMPTPSLPSALA